MEERGELVVNVRGKIFPRQELVDPRAQDGDGCFQLMRSIRGKTCGALEFFAGGFECGFGSFALRAIFFGSDCESLAAIVFAFVSSVPRDDR